MFPRKIHGTYFAPRGFSLDLSLSLYIYLIYNLRNIGTGRRDVLFLFCRHFTPPPYILYIGYVLTKNHVRLLVNDVVIVHRFSCGTRPIAHVCPTSGVGCDRDCVSGYHAVHGPRDIFPTLTYQSPTPPPPVTLNVTVSNRLA